MNKLIKMILYLTTCGMTAGIGPSGGVRTKDSYEPWLRALGAEQMISERQRDCSRGYELKKFSGLISLCWSQKLESPGHFAHATWYSDFKWHDHCRTTAFKLGSIGRWHSCPSAEGPCA